MYPINPFNPYQGVNPNYLQQPNTRAVVPTQIVRVNGRGGAEAYQMAANSSVLLLDETQAVVWLKQTDGAGYASLTAYDITQHEEQAPVDLRNIEQRISNLERIMRNESNTTKHGEQQNVTSKADDRNVERHK